MKRKVQLPGLPPITVVSDDEAEEIEYLVCAPATEEPIFDDNFFGTCCSCGTRVQYRWHAPRKPQKICMACALERMAQEEREKKNC
jgi:hypothetical protein